MCWGMRWSGEEILQHRHVYALVPFRVQHVCRMVKMPATIAARWATHRSAGWHSKLSSLPHRACCACVVGRRQVGVALAGLSAAPCPLVCQPCPGLRRSWTLSRCTTARWRAWSLTHLGVSGSSTTCWGQVRAVRARPEGLHVHTVPLVLSPTRAHNLMSPCSWPPA